MWRLPSQLANLNEPESSRARLHSFLALILFVRSPVLIELFELILHMLLALLDASC
jgi:hypothetical protein